MIRFVRPALGLAVLVASALPAQDNRVRWNDVMASLGEEPKDPPTVRVWLDQRIYRAGEAVRVGYRVEEDAFVVVARVDFDGNLTVLHPSGRNRVTTVSGGNDNFIRSARMGARATFVANERVGSTGYVFAIASRFPLDVSRLSQRDFSAWVTGVAVGQPMTRYIGDPYRVIQRFARLVLYDPSDEWDYDMEFYSVDQPIYTTTAFSGFAGSCGYDRFNGYGSMNGWGFHPSSGYGTSLFDDGYGYSYGYNRGGCSSYNYLSCFNASWAFGSYIPVFCGFPRGTQVATGPVPPPVRPDTDDSSRVNPWVPDSVTRPNVEKGTANGPHMMTVDPTRPNPVATGWRAEDDLSFSIPSRALRGSRTRDGSSDLKRAPQSSTGNGPMPMPSRPTIEVANQPIEWVRPPRSLEPTSRGEIDRMPSRGGRNRDDGMSRDNGRGNERGSGAMPDWNPPPRASSPMFDREPNRGTSPGFSSPPQRDYNQGGGRSFDPPRGMDSRPPSPSGLESRPMSSPGMSSSPPPASPPPQPAASSGGAKSADPPERKPSGEKQP